MGEEKQKPVHRNKAGAKAGGKQPASGAGVRKLRIAVDKAIGLKCDQIGSAMVDKTLEGNVGIAKLMLSIVEPRTPGEKARKRRQVPSTAEGLANEPQWPGAKPEPLAETGGEDGNPEG
jgi:hypothetical protein